MSDINRQFVEDEFYSEPLLLWDLLPEPKRLHCEKGRCYVIVSSPEDGWSVGPHTDMDSSECCEEGDTVREAIFLAVKKARELGWIE